MNISISKQSWPINGSFTISRGSKTQADVVVVELNLGGYTGVGECVPYPRYGESVEQVVADLEKIAPQLHDETTQKEIQTLLPSGAARNALDCAWWDLQCKAQHKSIWQLLGLKPSNQQTAFTLSLDSAENMGKAALENGHRPLLKLKLAGEGDIERVAAVRKNSPDATIIVDANEGWTIDEYKEMVPKLSELNVSMIEQPFPSSHNEWLDGLERPITICADESCHDIEGLKKLVGRYDMINIKLDKTGGITEALALKHAAIDLGFQIMVGCMVGTSLGMAPAFVVGQGAQLVDLDGPLLLAKDRDNGFEFDASLMKVPTNKLWG